MIRVNLLPKEYQRVEHTPTPRLFAILCGVAVNCVLGAFLGIYILNWVKVATVERDQAIVDRDDMKERSREYDKLSKEVQKIERHQKATGSLEQQRMLLTPKIDQFLTLLPPGIWVTEIAASPETAPKSSKDSAKPAEMVFDCQTIGDPYDSISQFRKSLQGQVSGIDDPERKQKINEFAKEVLLPLPTISGYDAVKVTGGGSSFEGYGWTQAVRFKLRGTYDKKKKKK